MKVDISGVLSMGLVLATALDTLGNNAAATGRDLTHINEKRYEVLRLSGNTSKLGIVTRDPAAAATAREIHQIAERCAEYLDNIVVLLQLREQMKDRSDKWSTNFALSIRLAVHISDIDTLISDLDYSASAVHNADGNRQILQEGHALANRMAEARDLLKELSARTKKELASTSARE